MKNIFETSFLFQTYSVRRVEMGEKRNVYVTVAFAGVALMMAMVIGVVVMRRRSARYPQHQVRHHHQREKKVLINLKSQVKLKSFSWQVKLPLQRVKIS